jgi:hypothetical protein
MTASEIKYTKYFEELFKKENLDMIPIVDIRDRAGMTDYIDFLNNDDFTLNFCNNEKERVNVIRGIDKYNRPFISFLYKTIKDEIEYDYNIVTIFQRYSEGNFWMHASRVPVGLFSTGCSFDYPHNPSEENLFKLLAKLLDKREVSYENYSFLTKERHQIKLMLN